MPEFKLWLSGLKGKERSQVDDRLDRVMQHNHFGDMKYLGENLFELRWRSGRRAYFAFTMIEGGRGVLMLLGGDKNGQNQDIAHARKILEREVS